ncbi:hypothetical protein ASG57_10960 [Bradyrhizobium sp. Leaf396]|nr:hypothetical protein ASG57_10960 [Bradyrhizobium sp. Leaf396]
MFHVKRGGFVSRARWNAVILPTGAALFHVKHEDVVCNRLEEIDWPRWHRQRSIHSSMLVIARSLCEKAVQLLGAEDRRIRIASLRSQ